MKLSLEEVLLLITALDDRIGVLHSTRDPVIRKVREAKELQSRLHDERRRIS